LKLFSPIRLDFVAERYDIALARSTSTVLSQHDQDQFFCQFLDFWSIGHIYYFRRTAVYWRSNRHGEASHGIDGLDDLNTGQRHGQLQHHDAALWVGRH
jgi:hypothetical protein